MRYHDEFQHGPSIEQVARIGFYSILEFGTTYDIVGIFLYVNKVHGSALLRTVAA